MMPAYCLNICMALSNPHELHTIQDALSLVPLDMAAEWNQNLYMLSEKGLHSRHYARTGIFSA